MTVGLPGSTQPSNVKGLLGFSLAGTVGGLEESREVSSQRQPTIVTRLSFNQWLSNTPAYDSIFVSLSVPPLRVSRDVASTVSNRWVAGFQSVPWTVRPGVKTGISRGSSRTSLIEFAVRSEDPT